MADPDHSDTPTGIAGQTHAIPLKTLRAFESAARLLSFTKAADELDVTPGAISQQIKRLEHYAGTPLFRRTGRKVTLTEPGRASLPMLTTALNALTETAYAMRSWRRGHEKIVISVAPSFATKWLAHRLHLFQNSHPNTGIWVSADPTPNDFGNPDIDLAIRFGTGPWPALNCQKLLDETVLPVCSPDLIDPNGLMKAQDLRYHTLLHDTGPENDPSCPDWRTWLAARGVIPDSREWSGLHFDRTAMVVEAAAVGRGFALAKRAIAAADLLSGRLIAPFADGGVVIDSAYWLVWPRGRTQFTTVRVFIDWLTSQARSEDIGGV